VGVFALLKVGGAALPFDFWEWGNGDGGASGMEKPGCLSQTLMCGSIH
jgi:hypothetical protein